MDYSKFTPEFKDSILTELCDSLTPYTSPDFNWKDLGSDCALIHTCLKQFEERGFITHLSFKTEGYCALILTSKALDFVRAGGFRAEYEVFDIQMSKAIFELEKLQAEPGLEKHVETISAISGAFASIATAFVGLFGPRV